MTTAEATQTDWRQSVRQQLDALDPGATITHAIVHFTDDGPVLLDVAESQLGAEISSEDWASKVASGGEIAVHTLADVRQAGGPDDQETIDAAAAELGLTGEDPDNGKLFDVPRVKVLVDDTDPTVIKLAFGGTVELNRSDQADVDFYNRLKAGADASITLEAFVKGPSTVHRRDSEGNVDAVVAMKSLTVHSIIVEP